MALTKDQVIMTGTSTGVTLENYEGKYSIKAVRTYKGKDGNEVMTYDWIYPEVYDKDQKKRVVADKPRPMSVFLGDKEQAIKALTSILTGLGVTLQDLPEDTPPF